MNYRTVRDIGQIIKWTHIHKLGGIFYPKSFIRVIYTHFMRKGEEKKFEAIIANLSQKFNFISPKDFFDYFSKQRPIDGRCILMTFDDGLLSSYLIAKKVLSKFNIKAMFFIPTKILELNTPERMREFAWQNLYYGEVPKNSLHAEEYLTMGKDEIVDLYRDGHLIFPHTHNHRKLIEINTWEAVQEEIIKPKQILQDFFSYPVHAFAFPVGTERVVSSFCFPYIQQEYQFCFSALAGLNTLQTNRYFLHRDFIHPSFDVYHADNVLEGVFDYYYLVKMRRLKKALANINTESGKTECRFDENEKKTHAPPMRKVYFIQRVLADYRMPFFDALRLSLQEKGVELKLIYGFGNEHDEQRGYLATLDWAEKVQEKYIKFGKYHLVYQPYLKYLKDANLIIIAQEMKLLLNYILMWQRRSDKFRLAFWGHCMNYQELSSNFLNKVKRKLNNFTDWWFVYTAKEAEFIAKNGFPRERISVVQNSIDTATLQELRKRVAITQIEKVRFKLGINKNDKVGLFCGGLYKEKRLEFLIESCRRIKNKIPEFHLVVLGGGPGETYINKIVLENHWIHYLGPVYNDSERVLYFMAADIFLLPGLVGLAILDSFTFSVPLITTDFPFHSPEIEYLENGRNGIITKDSLEEYTDVVIKTLADDKKREMLIQGCRDSAQKYSIANMAENFSDGIEKCLQLPP